MRSIYVFVMMAAAIAGSFIAISQTQNVQGCQTNAEGCQKTQEAGTPAGDSPPEVSGCHAFAPVKDCVKDTIH